MNTHHSNGQWNDRNAMFLENDRLKMVFLPGGGHIASLTLKEGIGAELNPLWQPPWKGIAPDQFRMVDLPEYGGLPVGQFLASIVGHNLCFDFFGGPSEEEQAQGVGLHGEAAISNWEVTPTASGMDCAVDLRVLGLKFKRSIRLLAGESVIAFENEVENLRPEARQIGWQEHVTFGPPFLETGKTTFDCSATWGQVFPGEFSSKPRLKEGAQFQWPLVEGTDGEMVDLRIYPPAEPSGDFSAQLMNKTREWAWFTALHPEKRLLIGYLWRTEDFPWLGNWEENFSRPMAPWGGKSLTRGMEFGLSPFPMGREALQALGQVHGTPTLRPLEGGAKWRTRFYAFLTAVPEKCTGIAEVTMENGSIGITLRDSGEKIELKAPEVNAEE